MEDNMKALRIRYFDSPEEIIKKARARYGKHKNFTFAKFPDNSVRLIVMNGTCGDEEDFK